MAQNAYLDQCITGLRHFLLDLGVMELDNANNVDHQVSVSRRGLAVQEMTRLFFFPKITNA